MLMDSDVLMDSDEECAVIDRLVAQHNAAAAARAASGDQAAASSGVASRSTSAMGSAHASALPLQSSTAFTTVGATSTTVAVPANTTASAVSATSSANRVTTDVAGKPALRATGLTPAAALAAASIASVPHASAQPCDVCSAKLRGEPAPKRKCSCSAGVTVQRCHSAAIATERKRQFAVWIRANSAINNEPAWEVEDAFDSGPRRSVDQLNEFLHGPQFARALEEIPVAVDHMTHEWLGELAEKESTQMFYPVSHLISSNAFWQMALGSTVGALSTERQARTNRTFTTMAYPLRLSRCTGQLVAVTLK